jgi:hypothetical protein
METTQHGTGHARSHRRFPGQVYFVAGIRERRGGMHYVIHKDFSALTRYAQGTRRMVFLLPFAGGGV